jgi:hypothetical protein
MGRVGSAQDAANVILFLVSDLASYVIGQVLRAVLFYDGLKRSAKDVCAGDAPRFCFDLLAIIWPSLDSGAKRNALKKSGFERPFQARQSRLGMAS